MRAILILTICFAIQLQGCGFFAYEVSVPAAVPPGGQGRVVNDDAIELTLLPGMNVWIQVRNHTSSTSLPHKKLGILLWITSESGEESFSFDPGRVVLRFGGGEIVRLSSYGGPDLLRVNPRAVGSSCGWASQRLQVRTPQGPVQFRSRACFMLWFNTSAAPDRNFTLALEEVRKAGEHVAVPPIEFKKGTVRKYQQVL